MKKALFGLAESEDQAVNVVGQLRGAGFSRDDVADLFPDGSGTRHLAHEQRSKAPEGVVLGGGSGLVVGAAFAWLVSLGVLAIPGFESLVAAGPFVAALTGAGAGAIAGGAAGLVIGLQFPEFVALQYDNKMDSGNILISVHTEGGTERTRAKEIFKNPDRVTEAEVVMNSANDRRSIAK